MGKSRSLFSLSYMGDNVHFARTARLYYRLSSLLSPMSSDLCTNAVRQSRWALDPLLCSISFTSFRCKLISRYVHFLSYNFRIYRINGHSDYR